MQDFLSKLVGHKLDVFCGGASTLRGKAVKVEGGVLHMVDEDDRMFYVAVDRIVAVWEARENEQRAGFLKAGFK